MTTQATQQITIKLPRPHSQAQFDLISTRYSDVVLAGRRWGKTQVGVYRILYAATQNVGLYWWVGLSWRSASMKRAWRLLKFYARKIWKSLGQSTDGKIRESVNEIDLPNGSSIWMRSAEREDSLAGEAIRGVIVDEFTLMSETVWSEYLEATLLDYNGWAMFIGVPKGNNWAAQLWRNAAGRRGWRQHRYTTYDNPFMPRERIDDIKLNVTERLFSQEYLAEVLEDGGAVFRNVSACIATPPKPNEVTSVVIGVDWGKSNDYTVLVAMDEKTRRVIEIDRFNQISWTLQRGRLEQMAQRYNTRLILAESNSIGAPNIEELQKAGLPVQGFQTTSASKGQLVDSLALAFEQQSIGIPNDPVLIGELQAYEMERLPSGTWRYSAPDGGHDDCVIALALAYRAATVYTPFVFRVIRKGNI